MAARLVEAHMRIEPCRDCLLHRSDCRSREVGIAAAKRIWTKAGTISTKDSTEWVWLDGAGSWPSQAMHDLKSTLDRLRWHLPIIHVSHDAGKVGYFGA